MEKWKKHFPFTNPRAEQIEAIQFALQAFKRKSFVILELGSGIGKSAIAITLLSLLAEEDAEANGYILVTQKILQKQYLRDFEDEPYSLRSCISAANFKCREYAAQTCAETYRLRGYANNKARYCESCPYSSARKDFVSAPMAITNYAYFLAESLYANSIKRRRMLVCDEAHNIEEMLTDFVSIKVDEKSAAKLKLQAPKKGASTEDVYEWLYEKYMPAVDRRILKLAVRVKDTDDEDERVAIARKIDRLDKHSCKVARISKVGFNPDDWVMQEKRENERSWTFHPINVDKLASEFLFRYGAKRLLMTATVLDIHYFTRNLGIHDYEFISMDSPYDPERRPIYYMPSGKMSMNEINRSLPKAAKQVERILDSHYNEKGIVHVVNFKVAEFLSHYRWSPKNRKRLLIQTKGKDRAHLLELHMKSKLPTVLITPSMTEGVDLKDGLSRFQVFVKLPFPNMGSKIIRKRMKLNYNSYRFATVRAIIQGVGRSMRHAKDHCTTYILDECWQRFYQSSQRYFPPSFKRAMKEKENRL